MSPFLGNHDLAGSVETGSFMELPVPPVFIWSDLTGTWDFPNQLAALRSQLFHSSAGRVTAAAPKGTHGKLLTLCFSQTL